MRHHFKNSADGIAGACGLLDLFLHAGFGIGIHATQQNFILGCHGGDLVPPGGAVQFDAAYADDVAGHFDAQRPQHQLGQGSGGHAAGRFAGRSAFQHVAGVGKVVLESAGKVGVAGPRRSDRLVQGRIAGLDGQLIFPVLPVAVHDFDRNRRAYGLAVAHAGKHVCLVGFNLHAAAAAIALLPAPQFAVHEFQIDGHAGRQPGDKRDKCFSVRLAGC